MSFGRVMHYFGEISKIPRGSGNTEKISSYCESFAREKKLDCVRDSAGNVIIRKPGKGAPVMLQGHVDMVCESEPGTVHDFENEGVCLVNDGEFISAENTTLGADDGSAAAIIFALLEGDNGGLPPIEAVFTVDEETGMTGAKTLDMSLLKARSMINIDSEEEGIITAGCAGGAVVSMSLPLIRKFRKGCKYEITVSGLTGGHSGTEIGKNRANANKLLGKTLRAILNKVPFEIVSAEGGNKDNAIPRVAKAFIVTDDDETARINKICEFCRSVFEKEYSGVESGIEVSCVFCGVSTENAAPPESFIKLLCSVPSGALEYDAYKNVMTSLNMGIMYSEERQQIIRFSLRSNLRGGTEKLAEKIAVLAKGFGAETETGGEYPCWEYAENSPLRELVKKHYKRLAGREAEVDVIHAGLECGIFASQIKGLDAVSIGPDIYDIHTPKEKMSIASFERTYELIKAVLLDIAGQK